MSAPFQALFARLKQPYGVATTVLSKGKRIRSVFDRVSGRDAKRSTSQREAEGPPHIRSFLSRLASLPDPVSHHGVLLAMKQSNLLPDSYLHKYLLRLFSDRRTAAIDHILHDEELSPAEVRVFHHLKLSNYRGSRSDHLERGVTIYLALADSHFLKHSLLLQVLEQALYSKRTDVIKLLIERIGEDAASHLRKSSFSSIIRYLVAEGEHNLAKSLIETFARTDEDRLLVLEELHALNVVSSPPRWREVLDAFERSYTLEDRDDVLKYVIQRLRDIPPGRTDLLDIRFSPTERNNLKHLLLQKLKAEEPCSLIRLSSGEGYPFSRPPLKMADTETFDTDDESRERNWWGTTIPAELRASLKLQVRGAIARADILGIPSIYRLCKSQSGEPFSGRRSTRGLMTVLSQLGGEIPREGKYFTEERCHHLLFTRPFLSELAAHAKNLVVVGCWGEEALGDFGRSATTIRVSPEHRAGEANADRELPPLWMNYEDVCERVSAASGPGTLVLVGAGILGKGIVDRARSAGAVALDVGAVMDSLAGYATRSPSDTIRLAS